MHGFYWVWFVILGVQHSISTWISRPESIYVLFFIIIAFDENKAKTDTAGSFAKCSGN